MIVKKIRPCNVGPWPGLFVKRDEHETSVTICLYWMPQEHVHEKTVRSNVHLLQIWIVPETKGIKPGYEQKEFSRDEMRGRLRLIAARNPVADAVMIHQNVRLFAWMAKLSGTISSPAVMPGSNSHADQCK